MNPGEMNVSWNLDSMVDRYELKARLFPGLLVLLPPVIFLALLYGTTDQAIMAVGTVLVACGGPYLLSSFVRTWGQRAQDRLYRKWGAQPSTIVLRHRDSHISPQTKTRYHQLATTRLGITMPSADEEQRNHPYADQCYVAAGDALRPLTNDRKSFPLLYKELVAYGFNRNAHGSRWVGLCVAMATAIVTIAHAGAMHVQSPYWTVPSLSLGHTLVAGISLLMSMLWCLHFTEETVKVAGFSYAKRLWEALEKIPKQSF